MASFCSPGRGQMCKGDNHTFACRGREALGMRMVTWLRDEVEADLRARVASEKGRALDSIEMMALFLRWECLEFAQFQLDLASANIVNHRSITDLGGFIASLDVATEIVQEEVARKAAQTNLKVKDRAGANPHELWLPRN